MFNCDPGPLWEVDLKETILGELPIRGYRSFNSIINAMYSGRSSFQGHGYKLP